MNFNFFPQRDNRIPYMNASITAQHKHEPAMKANLPNLPNFTNQLELRKISIADVWGVCKCFCFDYTAILMDREPDALSIRPRYHIHFTTYFWFFLFGCLANYTKIVNCDNSKYNLMNLIRHLLCAFCPLQCFRSNKLSCSAILGRSI